ncbi:MAG TPA: hypothetical protein VGQ42_02225 [Candidatus Dormibacteraeota bacterium]|jgi:hypothetical protein|nr:hypothetical protein [Candidatus Dormibacteraeota bacterium]
MSRVLYIEPDDEITDLVEKIRRSGEEQDLVFVLPHRTKVLQSSLNLRLLQQYSRSFVKRTAIVSGDPRVQQLAKSAGFPTYASVQAYERGVEVVRPHPAAEPLNPEVDGDGAVAPDMAPIGAAAAAATLAETPWTAAALERPESPARTLDRPMPPRRIAPMPLPKKGRDRRRALYFLAGAVFIVGLLLLFLVAPTATVTIKMAAAQVTTNQPIQGTTDANLAGSQDHVLTVVETSDQNGSFQAKPTGQKTLPATQASAQEILSTDLKNVADFTIPKGTEFDTAGSPQIKFYATQDTVVHFGAPDSNGISTSNAFPVQDGTPENAGNVGANTITQWPSNPCGPSGQYHGVCTSTDLTVTNPQAAGGGADAKQVTTASSGDISGWTKQIDDMKTQLTDKTKADMASKAGPNKLVAVDPGGSGQTLSYEITPLPKQDEQYQATTINVVVHGKAAFFNIADVKKVVEADLKTQVPPGQTLADKPNIPDPKVTQASDDGTVIFTASGTGFSEPVIDIQGLKGRFSGQSATTVKRLAREIIGSPVQDVTISQHIPFFVLPYFSGRIDIVQQFTPVGQ